MDRIELEAKIKDWQRQELSRLDRAELIKAYSDNGDLETLLRFNDSLEPLQSQSKGYISTDGKGKESLDLAKLISDILDEDTFATMNDNDEILVYRDGFYQTNGGRHIKTQCQVKVGITALLTEHKIQEVIGHIVRSTYTDRGLFNANKYVLNLKNGLLDVRTRKLTPHTSKFLSTIRIPVTYDPAADCPAIKKFMSEVHKPDDILVIQEVIGYCFIPDNTIQKAILYVGIGGEGKSTELNLVRAAVGKDNTSNVSWHKLELNRFALSALENKLVNTFADLPSQSLNTTTSFKLLTGGDAIGTEKKFGDPYSFTNFARLIFSTNKPPKIYDDDSYAFWRRWLIIEFPNQIPEDKQEKNILDDLTTEVELSGLLNWGLEGLDRVLKQQGYSYQKTVEETTEYYLRAADPVYAFLTDKCEADSAGWVTKDDLYETFAKYAITNSIPLLKPNAFARALTNQTVIRIRSTRPIINGKRTTAWEGVKIAESVKDVNDFSSIKPNSAPVQENILNKEKNLDNPDRKPPEKTFKCQCGNTEYWIRVTGEKVCSRCHPEPGRNK